MTQMSMGEWVYWVVYVVGVWTQVVSDITWMHNTSLRNVVCTCMSCYIYTWIHGQKSLMYLDVPSHMIVVFIKQHSIHHTMYWPIALVSVIYIFMYSIQFIFFGIDLSKFHGTYLWATFCFSYFSRFLLLADCHPLAVWHISSLQINNLLLSLLLKRADIMAEGRERRKKSNRKVWGHGMANRKRNSLEDPEPVYQKNASLFSVLSWTPTATELCHVSQCIIYIFID